MSNELPPFVARIGKYLHVSGDEYMVVCLTRHGQTAEKMIVYTHRAMEYYVLPETTFFAEVEWPDGTTKPMFVQVNG